MTRLTRTLALLVLPVALAACDAAGTGMSISAPSDQQLDWRNADAAVARAFASTLETPFANGPMQVIATEGGQIRSFRLIPCGGGAAVCAGSLYGAAGTVEVTPDFHIVRGLYGRTFWLAPGGAGSIEYRNGTTLPLAWDSIDRPVTAWETARLAEGPARD